MKKIQALLLAASVLFAASCQEEIASPEAENPEVGTSTLEVITITGTTQSETKTALDGLSTLWVEGDMISVFDANKDGNNRCFPVVEITNENKTATFSYEKGDFKMDHTQKDPTLVALYPYQESAYCDFFYYDRNYIKNLVVPAEQTAVANGFDANATFAIALGTMNTRESLNFQNLYSLLKFHVETPNVTSVTVTVGGENAYIAGDAKVQMQLNKELINNEEGEPVFFDPVLSALPDGGSKSVTLECEEGFSTDANVFYYIAVAPTTIESVQVALNETVVKSATKTMSFEANKIHSLGKLDYNRIDRELAFSDVPTTAVVGGDFDEPELTGTTDGVKYTSSNTDVATVDESTGEVTLVGVGETTITASAPKTDALLAGEANYTLTVTKATRTILFSEAPAEVTYGEDYAEPTLTVTPEASATYSVTKGAEAVSVDSKTGVVTINKAADVVEITATVEATDSYEKATASYTFKVNKADRTVSFSPETAIIGNPKNFTKPSLNGIADGDQVTYSSSDINIATVANDGTVARVKEGSVTITATIAETDTYKECSASYTLTVLKALYLKPNTNWNADGARFAACFMDANKSNHTWENLVKEGTDAIYHVYVPVSHDFKYVIFCRMNPSISTNGWDYKWNQTNDLDIPADDKKYFVIKKGSWDKGAQDEWMTEANAKAYVEPEDPKPTTKTIYLKPGVWTTANAKFEAWTWGGSTADSWVKFEKVDDTFYKTEIPVDRTSMKILRKDPSSASESWSSWNDSGNQDIPSDKDMFIVNDWGNYSWGNKE